MHEQVECFDKFLHLLQGCLLKRFIFAVGALDVFSWVLVVLFGHGEPRV